MLGSSEDLKQTAAREVKLYSVFRLESALTIAATILLAFFLPEPFPWWRWWYWLVLGALFEAAIIYTSLTDQGTANRVVAAMLREQYDIRDIRTPRYRDKLKQALDYRERLQHAVEAMPSSVLQEHLNDSSQGVARWIGTIYELAQRLDAFAEDNLIKEDARQLPRDIAVLERDLQQEASATVRQQIKATLQAKRGQMDSLRDLEDRMQQAELRLDESVASLGTVYSQFRLIQARKMEGIKLRSLSDDIGEQVQSLRDIMDSMDQLYGVEE